MPLLHNRIRSLLKSDSVKNNTIKLARFSPSSKGFFIEEMC